MRGRRVMALTLGLLALPSMAGTPLPDGPHVVATGSGKVMVAPDMAEITVSSEVNDASAARAKQKVDAAVNAFLLALRQQGVTEEDIKASDLSINEDVDTNDDGRRISNGYDASRTVTFKLRDLARLNAVLDAALEAGMNRFRGTRFVSSREDVLRAKARVDAAQDAKERASEIASGFNARLGAIYSINSANSSLSSHYRYDTNSLDSVTVTGSRAHPGRYLQPEIEFNESVTAVFSLLP